MTYSYTFYIRVLSLNHIKKFYYYIDINLIKCIGFINLSDFKKNVILIDFNELRNIWYVTKYIFKLVLPFMILKN